MTGITNASKRRSGRGANSVTTLNALLRRLILICVLPLVLLSVYLAYTRVLDMQEDSSREATSIAGNFAMALDHNLTARIAGLQVLAASAFVDE
ncbi:MAG: hypothetical protein LH481_09265, partial [Burkholderiales bacterium]|nr:hypothetical protein [Burkholderiales bacterium]